MKWKGTRMARMGRIFADQEFEMGLLKLPAAHRPAQRGGAAQSLFFTEIAS
jgi:hypothetical protein